MVSPIPTGERLLILSRNIHATQVRSLPKITSVILQVPKATYNQLRDPFTEPQNESKQS